MRTPMIFAFGAWLNSLCTQSNLPPVLMDDLNETGTSLCLSQTSADRTLKEYIDGSRVGQLEANLYAQGNIDSKADLIDYLTQIAIVLENTRDMDIDEEHRILRATATAPSIVQRTESDILRYVSSISLSYKEI